MSHVIARVRGSAATGVLAIAAILVAAVLVACGGGGTGSPSALPTVETPPPPHAPTEVATFPADTQKQLQDALTAVMKKDHIPGVLIGVWAPGKGDWVHAEGVAGFPGAPGTGSDLKMRLDDRVRIASNTKTFTAVTVLILAQEGFFKLDDPIDKYVFGVPNGDEVTIRQLLNMTSGVYSFTEDPAFGRRFTRDPLMSMTPQEMIVIAAEHGPDFPPGTDWHYSDTNYEILGLLIQNVTGQDAGDVIMNRVCYRLGLRDTSFPTTAPMPEPYSRGYVYQGDHGGTGPGSGYKDYTFLNPQVPWTGGAMVSTLGDLRTWAQALGSGSLLTPEMQKEQFTWVDIPGTDGKNKYGLGVMELFGFRGHHGAIFGFNSIILYSPVEKATVVIVTNKSTNASGESTDILAAVMPLVWPEKFANE
jgi:D-alanyl-D-alanine carboxypeptidase